MLICSLTTCPTQCLSRFQGCGSGGWERGERVSLGSLFSRPSHLFGLTVSLVLTASCRWLLFLLGVHALQWCPALQLLQFNYPYFSHCLSSGYSWLQFSLSHCLFLHLAAAVGHPLIGAAHGRHVRIVKIVMLQETLRFALYCRGTQCIADSLLARKCQAAQFWLTKP